MNLVISITLQGSSFPVLCIHTSVSMEINSHSFIRKPTHICQIMRHMDKTPPHYIMLTGSVHVVCLRNAPY